jgi:hypothetical protein
MWKVTSRDLREVVHAETVLEVILPIPSAASQKSLFPMFEGWLLIPSPLTRVRHSRSRGHEGGPAHTSPLLQGLRRLPSLPHLITAIVCLLGESTKTEMQQKRRTISTGRDGVGLGRHWNWRFCPWDRQAPSKISYLVQTVWMYQLPRGKVSILMLLCISCMHLQLAAWILCGKVHRKMHTIITTI